jgi:Ferritin-like domain
MPAQVIATELAKNEREHVVFLRTALGDDAVDMPQINM